MGHPNAEFKTQEEIDRSLLEWKSAMVRDIKTQTLIDTFENKFSNENYKKFVREFFELSADDFVGQTVSPRNNHHIKSHTHIANYNVDPKTRVAIFSVCLNRGGPFGTSKNCSA